MNRVLWWVELRRKTLTNLKMSGQSHVFETFAELSPPHCILAKAASTYFFKTMPVIQSISSPGWRLSAVDQLLKFFVSSLLKPLTSFARLISILDLAPGSMMNCYVVRQFSDADL